jgi:hypothetical protein
VYKSILQEVIQERVHRQIGRSAPRVLKTQTRKYLMLTKNKRKQGMFGYRKALAAQDQLIVIARNRPVYA